MKHNKKTIFILILLAGFVLFLCKCMNHQMESADPRGNVYAGAAACRQCHQAIFDSFFTTAHAKATSNPIAENIHGNFSNEKNTFHYDGNNKMMMEKRADGFYQVLYKDGKEKAAYKLDLLFGSRNAQTSVYWQNDRFFELPLSHYVSVNAWGTSPGFPADFPKLDRVVNETCLDCHSSGINIKPGAPFGSEQLFDRESLIVGIDCERCHGPAINHVNYHLANPGLNNAFYMTKHSTLTRQQKLDACAICHSGNDKEKIQSRFQFKMGDTLAYFVMQHPGESKQDVDVHGNQFTLMQQSSCFRNTKNMTCGTCHDPHKNATADLSTYSQKCMSCHKPQEENFCPKYTSLGESIKSNCIDCHMPKMASKAINFQLQQSNFFSSYLLRTHKIAVYNDSILATHDKVVALKKQ